MQTEKVGIKSHSVTDIFAAILLGVGLAMGFIPIMLASLIIRHNLFLEVFDRMDGFWKGRGYE